VSLALKAYTAFKDDEAKAKALSEIFAEVEANFLKKEDSVNRHDLKEVELALQLEIEKVRKEVKEIESNLRLEIKEVEGRLAVQIEQTKSELIRHMNRHIIWVIGSITLVVGLLKALDYVLK